MLQTSILLVKSLNKTGVFWGFFVVFFSFLLSLFLSVMCSLFPKANCFTFIVQKTVQIQIKRHRMKDNKEHV